MAVSDVDIANRALVKIGEQRITSFDDDNKASRAVKALYPTVRDSELRKHRWNFATKRAQLAALATAPAFGFDYAYQLPSDCLRVDFVGDFYPGVDLSDYRNADSSEWRVEARTILTNLSAPLNLRYGARITDPTQFDAMFVEALAAKLAIELADVLTQTGTRKEQAKADYQDAMRTARSLDAIEDPPQQMPDTSWTLGRL